MTKTPDGLTDRLAEEQIIDGAAREIERWIAAVAVDGSLSGQAAHSSRIAVREAVQAMSDRARSDRVSPVEGAKGEDGFSTCGNCGRSSVPRSATECPYCHCTFAKIGWRIPAPSLDDRMNGPPMTDATARAIEDLLPPEAPTSLDDRSAPVPRDTLLNLVAAAYAFKADNGPVQCNLMSQALRAASRELWIAPTYAAPPAGAVQITDADPFADKYHELLLAVGNKYPNESRHATALRYIREREQAINGAGSNGTPSRAPGGQK